MKFLALLFLMVAASCGKSDKTHAPATPRGLYALNPGGGGGGYQKTLALELLSFSTDAVPSKEEIPHIGDHLVIKDKAMYRHAHGLGLEGSFGFDDDRRLSLNPTFVGSRILRDVLAASEEGTLRVGFRLTLLNNSTVREVGIEFKSLDLESDAFEPLAGGEVERWRDYDIVFEPRSRTIDEGLFIETGRIDPEALNVVELSHFRDDAGPSLDRYKQLFSETARIYLNTSKGEEVVYVAPGINIRDFLRTRFGSAAFSVDGELRELGDDGTDLTSPLEIREVDSHLWLQHPAKIARGDAFAAGEEYIFIFLEAAELLRQNFWQTATEKHRFGGKLELDFEGVGIDYATVELVKKVHFLKDEQRSIEVFARGPEIRHHDFWNFDLGGRDDCGGEAAGGGGEWCMGLFKRYGTREEIVDLGDALPGVKNGGLRAVYRNRADKGVLVELSRGFDADKLELSKTKKDNLTTATDGYTGRHWCRTHNIGHINHIWHKQVSSGDEFFYDVHLHRRGIDL